jgi:hypothetical protein
MICAPVGSGRSGTGTTTTGRPMKEMERGSKSFGGLGLGNEGRIADDAVIRSG